MPPSAAASTSTPRRRTLCSSSSGGVSSSSSSSTDGATDSGTQWALLRVAGDGRCMFRSLAQGAQLAAQADSGAAQPQLLPPDQETAAADALRAAVCAELLKRREELCFFIDEDYDAYVARMQRPHTWGGEPELAVVTHVLQRPVAVYSPAAQQVALVSRYGDEEYAGRADVPLLFSGGGHYDLLVRQAAADGAAPRSRL